MKFDTKREDGSGVLKILVSEQHAGSRLDATIAKASGQLSRSRYKSLIKEGFVTLNDEITIEPNEKVRAGDSVLVQLPPAEDPVPKGEEIPLNILFEDDSVIVIDKPAGLVVHPGPGNWHGTLVNALIHHCGDSLSGIGGVKRPGIVHRLDKDTSGVMVVAKTDEAHLGLSRQFADHGRTNALEREYDALVWNAPDPPSGTIDEPIDRSEHNRLKMRVVNRRDDLSHRGRHAVTHYTTRKVYPDADGIPVASLVCCSLETGRTHQIRVHMAHIGNPLVGDDVYGSGFKTKSNTLPEQSARTVIKFRRQALFARLLQFEHPVAHSVMRFEIGPPKDWQKLLEAFTLS